jgi:hypothetical protein
MSSGSEERTMHTGSEPTDLQATSPDTPQTEAATPTEETGAQETQIEPTAAVGTQTGSPAARPTGQPTDTESTAPLATATEPTDTEHTDTEPADTEHTDTEHTDTEHTDTEQTHAEHQGTERMDTERMDTERMDTGRMDTGPAAQPEAAPTAWGYPPQESAAEPPRGPALAPILLGVLVLATAAFALADQALDVSVDWGQVGPVGILLGGGVLVLLGLLGMRRRPR